jgi:hypothetical protein
MLKQRMQQFWMGAAIAVCAASIAAPAPAQRAGLQDWIRQQRAVVSRRGSAKRAQRS